MWLREISQKASQDLLRIGENLDWLRNSRALISNCAVMGWGAKGRTCPSVTVQFSSACTTINLAPTYSGSGCYLTAATASTEEEQGRMEDRLLKIVSGRTVHQERLSMQGRYWLFHWAESLIVPNHWFRESRGPKPGNPTASLVKVLKLSTYFIVMALRFILQSIPVSKNTV